MNKTIWAAVLMAGFAVAAGRQDDLSKIVTGADKGKKSSRKITAEQAKAIAVATGLKPEEVETSLSVLEGLAPVPEMSEKDKVLATIVTVATSKGPVKLAVAVATGTDCVVAVKVVENKGDKAAESKVFLEQFEGFAWSDAIRRPGSDLKPAMDKARGGAEGAALVDFCVKMRRMEPLWQAAEAKNDAGDKSSAKDAEQVAKLFEELAAKPADGSFLNARQRDTLKADLLKSAQAIRDWLPQAGDGSPGSKKGLGEITGQCAKCHGSMPWRFREARAKLGLGNGWFSPDLDLIVPADGPRELFESMARAIHKAALQLRDAK